MSAELGSMVTLAITGSLLDTDAVAELVCCAIRSVAVTSQVMLSLTLAVLGEGEGVAVPEHCASGVIGPKTVVVGVSWDR